MATAAFPFDFVATREHFNSTLIKCLEDDSLSRLESSFAEASGSDSEKKMAVDQAFKDVLYKHIGENRGTDVCIKLLSLAIESVIQEMCSQPLPMHLLSDLFDGITLDRCDQVFGFVESRVSDWKSDVFYNSGKNFLLRMCNDLLRRLSRSQNTVFCGRIQLFLARLFPLSEISGLNIMSQFNVDNVTIYNTKAEDYDKARKQSMDEKEENMDIEEGEMDELSSSIPIDYNLYRKFWSLQDYFRKPLQCFDKAAWKSFCSASEEVLNCFRSFKLDDTKLTRKKTDNDPNTYFAKYLTSEKLLDLQLSDSNFRRYVLVQFLILFQYLTAQVKFKSQTLPDDQATWVKDTQDKVFSILQETPPDGEIFAKTIKHILSREENWNSWKNEGCSSYVKTASSQEETPVGKQRAKKRSLGEDLKASGGKLIKMGNGELTKLWNLCPNNMDACRAKERNFLPNLDTFFEEAAEQADPEAGIEDQYKLVKNSNFAWKAIRLLSRKSPYFFAQQTSQQIQKQMPEYLEDMISKLNKDKPTTAEEVKTETEEGQEENTEVENGNMDSLDKDSEKKTEVEEEEEESGDLVTEDQCELLASKLGSEWKKLATELNFPDEDITFLETENPDVTIQAAKMLTLWQENEDERATVDALRLALKEIGEVSMATIVFGEEDTT